MDESSSRARGQQANKQGSLSNNQQKPIHTRRFSIASSPSTTSTPLPDPLSSTNLLACERFSQKLDPSSPKKRHTRHLSLGNHGISRHGTLLTPNATPTRTTAELESILGNRHARLKTKAALVHIDSGSAVFNRHVTLEQAKPRARVEVDILPQSNVCVQGGYLRGYFKIYVREKTIKEGPIDIGEGKIRIIGFEGQGDKTKSMFYQCSAVLSSITPSLAGLWDTELDPEGFAPAIEGEHKFPFSLYIPLSTENGQAKGVHRGQSGTYLNYIAMISLKVKDESGRRSIAHFYRACEVWPRLDPSSVLSSGLRPLQATVSATSGNDPDTGRIKLTASLHRLHWVAGQRCYVKIIADNKTKKTLKELTLILRRSTTIMPSVIGTTKESNLRKPWTSVKHVSESRLEMGRMATKGHASAKGWWTGVRPGQVSEFEHHIVIPSDALTISRGQTFGVEYSLRIAIESGFRLTSGLELEIPIRIINFISIDPPPSLPVALRASIPPHPVQNPEIKSTPLNYNDGTRESNQNNNFQGTANNFYRDTHNMPSGNSITSNPDTQEAGLRNLSLSDDTDEVVQSAIVTAHPLTEMEMMGYASFSGLYYASSGNGNRTTLGDSGNYSSEFPEQSIEDDDSITWAFNHFVDEVSMSNGSAIETKETRPPHVPGKSSFAARVEEKISNATAAYLNDITLENSSQEEERLDISFKSTQWDGTGRPQHKLQVPHGPGKNQVPYSQAAQTSNSQQHLCYNDPSFQPLHEIQSALARMHDINSIDSRSDTSSWLDRSTAPPSVPYTSVQGSASRLFSLPGLDETLREQINLMTMTDGHEFNETCRDGQEEERKSATEIISNTVHLPRGDSGERQVESGGSMLTLTIPTSATSTTSTATSIGNTSVRDKVRELEERVKALV